MRNASRSRRRQLHFATHKNACGGENPCARLSSARHKSLQGLGVLSNRKLKWQEAMRTQDALTGRLYQTGARLENNTLEVHGEIQSCAVVENAVPRRGRQQQQVVFFASKAPPPRPLQKNSSYTVVRCGSCIRRREWPFESLQQGLANHEPHEPRATRLIGVYRRRRSRAQKKASLWG